MPVSNKKQEFEQRKRIKLFDDGEYTEELCAVHGLQQHVQCATRGRNRLDLVLSDLEERVSIKPTNPIGSSDHVTLLASINTKPFQQNEDRYRLSSSNCAACIRQAKARESARLRWLLNSGSLHTLQKMVVNRQKSWR